MAAAASGRNLRRRAPAGRAGSRAGDAASGLAARRASYRARCRDQVAIVDDLRAWNASAEFLFFMSLIEREDVFALGENVIAVEAGTDRGARPAARCFATAAVGNSRTAWPASRTSSTVPLIARPSRAGNHDLPRCGFDARSGGSAYARGSLAAPADRNSRRRYSLASQRRRDSARAT